MFGVYAAAMKLGVIGCGKMGTALVEGAVRSSAVKAENVRGVDLYAGARDQFAKATGGSVSEQISDLAECDVVLACTKPNDIGAAIGQLSEAAGSRPMLIISIAAGVPIHALEAHTGQGMRVIRAMPNTPALVGKGAAAYCLGIKATADDAKLASDLLGSVGLAVQVPERLMDAVTGLSGSGPAYVYLLIEALADGGVKQGLPRADSIQLAAQTVFGAAAMVLETGQHPALLKDMVTSPGGTTIAGLSVLEKNGFRSALIDAVTAASERAAELGK